MKKTTNFGFKLPEASDFIDPSHYNENFTDIDKQLKELERVKGHKHSAEDITSGVFAEARIPVLSDSERIVATAVGAYNEQIPKGTHVIYTFPWSAKLSKCPKRVRIEIVQGSGSKAVGSPDCNHDGGNVVMDLMYNAAEDRFDADVSTYAQTFALNTGAKCVYHRGLYFDVGGREVTSTGYLSQHLFNITVRDYGDQTVWTGRGGRAFMPASKGGETSEVVYVGGFQYDEKGLSFVFSHAMGGQYNAFCILAYAID